MSARTVIASLRTGDRIAEKYIVDSPLAAGGMGEVWGAVNEATQAPVALKVIHAEAANDEIVRCRLEQEARIGATLAHRHIVRVFDLVRPADGSIVVVMELLRGESLGDYLKRRGTLTPKEAVSVLAPVLLALHFVHARGILHRDIKPANIFLALEPDGTVIPKLVDFGIAKHDEKGLTLAGDVLGTPQYLAPERIRGQRDVDGRSDLFSVGAVLYQLLAGRAPWDGQTTSAILAAVLEQEPEQDPAIDPRLWLVVRRALAKQSYERPGTAEEMLEERLAAVGLEQTSTTVALPDVRAVALPQPSRADIRLGVPVAAGPSSLAGASLQVSTTGRRSRTLVIGAAIVAGVSLTLGLGGLLLARSAPQPVALPAAPGPSPAAVVDLDETPPARAALSADVHADDAPAMPSSVIPAAERRGSTAAEGRPRTGKAKGTKGTPTSSKPLRKDEIGTTPGF